MKNVSYMSGGAGYVLSRAALSLIADGIQKNTPGCQESTEYEDVALGKPVKIKFQAFLYIIFAFI